MPSSIGHAVSDQREGGATFLRRSSLINLLSTPVVYSIGLPLLVLDAWTTVYQTICFPMYGIARVRRRDYFAIDRHRLPYLNAIEKLHCFYCSYATGVLSYVMEVAARTEQYWCPIKHAALSPLPHAHYQLFFDYGDSAGYHHGLPVLRQQLAASAAGGRRKERDHGAPHHRSLAMGRR